MSKTDEIRKEVKKAEKQKDSVKELNYHKYNNFIIDKGIELDKVKKQERRKAEYADSRKGAVEMAKEIHNMAVGKVSFGFHLPDHLISKRS